MRLLPVLLCFIVLLHSSFAPPVNPDKEKDSEVKDDLEEYMEYHRYLREVVQTLENDPEFRERLEKADEDDIRSGKIAEDLDFVNHNVRTKLDEIKRRELERLRHLATKQNEITKHNSYAKLMPTNEHLDHANPYTFEIEDLKKLIQKTTADLEAADKQRKQEFKEYEMQKEFEKTQKLENMSEADKKAYLEKVKAEEDAKKHHQPLHHPGSKQQLEEVWEKQDQMDQQFDPKAFFMMHDVDGNGVWDADEVKALFIKELDKIYGPNGPNKDLHERAEEMERMREHVFNENDKNHDGLIDFSEFMAETQKADFNKDEGWKSIDENQVYTQDEYNEFQRRRLEEVQFLQARGLVDYHGRPLPGAEHQIHQALQQYRNLQAHGQHMPGQQPMYPPGQVPQGHPQGVPPQGYPQGVQQGIPQGYQSQGHGYQQQAQTYPPQVPQGYQNQGQQVYQQQGYQQGYQQVASQNVPVGQQNQGHPNMNVQGQAPQAQQNINIQSPQGHQAQAPQVSHNANQQMPALGNAVPAQQPMPSQPPVMENQVYQQKQDSAQNEVHSNNPQLVQNQQHNVNVSPPAQAQGINNIPQGQPQGQQQVYSQNQVSPHDAAAKP